MEDRKREEEQSVLNIRMCKNIQAKGLDTGVFHDMSLDILSGAYSEEGII